MNKRLLYAVIGLLFALTALPLSARQIVVRLADYGVLPNDSADGGAMQGALRRALETVKQQSRGAEDTLRLVFERGTYYFLPEYATPVECYISNHDQQTTPRAVGIYLADWHHVVVDGASAKLLCTGRMLPIAIARCANVTVQDMQIDFDNPHIAEAQIVKNEGAKGITFDLSDEVQARVEAGRLVTFGRGWEGTPAWGITFERETKRIAYNTGDIGFELRKGVHHLGEHRYHATQWVDSRLAPGNKVAMRFWDRPNPGIFLMNDSNVTLERINIYYAEGMGVLAQACHEVRLHRFNVLNGKRCFSTQADATHFSGCSGRIVVEQCEFRNMMDDALNVHGIYLKVTARKNDRTLTARYMHDQAWGFEWGKAGEVVQFVDGNTVEVMGQSNTIASIRPIDKPTVLGVREFEIVFKHRLDKGITADKVIGIENLTRTPEVRFTQNLVANNRARGILINTPKQVVVKDNHFDHVSGTAILFSTDCGQWWESGRTASVEVVGNRFVNNLTSLYQFTDAIIAINPVVPALDKQHTPFYGTGRPMDIRIANNDFYTFDLPILYAKSVNGMQVHSNRIITTKAFPRFHPNTQPARYEHCLNVEAQSLVPTSVGEFSQKYGITNTSKEP